MNVIISNKYQTLLANLDIDVIKTKTGVFTIEELVAELSNFYFNKMIVDITALDNYENISTIQDLSLNFDTSKIILLLDDSEKVNSPMYISQLVSMGIYNFTKSIPAIKYLIDNPNKYKDVASYHQLDYSTTQKVSLNEKANQEDDTGSFMGQRVIGFQNITEGAGSTTLVYLLKKHLEDYYKVKAVEINSDDFLYFNDKSLESISGLQLPQFITNHPDYDVILVDINNERDIKGCDEIIYLIEPGLIKLNKLIRKDAHIFESLKGKKIVINKSILSEKDINDFEKESGSKVFYSLPYLDDKLDNQMVINQFLSTIGFSRIESTTGGNKLFNIFK